MRTDSLQVALRPRGGLEAVDLGLAMARAWWRPLASTWFAIVVPIGLAIVVLLRDQPLWAITLLWWLRPAFGRIPLHVLSRKLFGESADLRSTTAALPQLLRSGIIVSLFTQRLSPARTFLQPVLQLEGLRGTARRERSAILARQDIGAAMGLLSVGAHMNGALLVGLPLLVGILVPEEVSWRAGSLFNPLLGGDAEQGGGIVFSLLYLLGISLVEPLMVAGGFALYLNRRIFLEGWDIDLAFRRLASRAGAGAAGRPGAGERARSATAAAVVTALLLLGSGNARAGYDGCDPADARSAGGCIEQILATDDFGGSEEIMRWTPREFDTPELNLEAPGWVGELIAAVFQVAGWVLLGGLVLALAIAIARRVEPPELDLGAPPVRPARLFGLDLDPRTLPEDLLGAARQAWAQGHPIEAMSLLYRGALIRLVDHHGISIPESATEYQCVALAEARNDPEPARVFGELTNAWVAARYAAAPPSDDVFDGLCHGFAHTFDRPARGTA